MSGLVHVNTNLSAGEALPAHVQAQLDEAGCTAQVGQMFIDKSGEVFRINRIQEHEHHGHKYVSIHYGDNQDYECTQFRDSYGDFSPAQFEDKIKDKGWIRIVGSVADYRAKALAVFNGETTADSYRDTSTDATNSETALMGKASKYALQCMQTDLEEKKNNVLLIARFMELEMNKRKADLEKIKEGMYGVLAEFQKKIKKIMRVITVIELYLGVDEELVQIQEGELAPADTTINFRQAVLFIDEEIGHWKDGGLDFTNIDWFDKWLCENDNYKTVLPEQKGIVVLRPRRNIKDYKMGKSEAQYEAFLNSMNLNHTYLLIRNGDNLYRVFTEKLVIKDRLFPKRSELAEMMDKMNSITDEEDYESNQDKRDAVDDMQYPYRKRAVLMQGLIDRTEVFHPLPAAKINIFNLDELGDKVNFIYDDEALLPTGKLGFWAWHEHLNSSIKHGSRIMLTGYYRDNGFYSRDRIFYYVNEHNAPPAPEQGIYDVEAFRSASHAWLPEEKYEAQKEWILNIIDTRQSSLCRKWEQIKKEGRDPVKNTDDYVKEYYVAYKKEFLTIMHNPQDTVYGGWGNYKSTERQKRIRYKIFKSDKFLLHYDKLELADVDFYLTSRVDRPNYLGMMPVLQKIKAFLLEEQALEKDFTKLIAGAAKASLQTLSDDAIQRRVERTISWWKYKNELKRSLNKDDSLAYRMILGRVTSKNWKNLKWEDQEQEK